MKKNLSMTKKSNSPSPPYTKVCQIDRGFESFTSEISSIFDKPIIKSMKVPHNLRATKHAGSITFSIISIKLMCSFSAGMGLTNDQNDIGHVTFLFK